MALAAEPARGCCLGRVDIAGARVVRAIDEEISRIRAHRNLGSGLVWLQSCAKASRWSVVDVHHVLVVAGGASHEGGRRIGAAIGHGESASPWAAGDRWISVVRCESRV